MSFSRTHQIIFNLKKQNASALTVLSEICADYLEVKNKESNSRFYMVKTAFNKGMGANSDARKSSLDCAHYYKNSTRRTENGDIIIEQEEKEVDETQLLSHLNKAFANDEESDAQGISFAETRNSFKQLLSCFFTFYPEYYSSLAYPIALELSLTPFNPFSSSHISTWVTEIINKIQSTYARIGGYKYNNYERENAAHMLGRTGSLIPKIYHQNVFDALIYSLANNPERSNVRKAAMISLANLTSIFSTELNIEIRKTLFSQLESENINDRLAAGESIVILCEHCPDMHGKIESKMQACFGSNDRTLKIAAIHIMKKLFETTQNKLLKKQTSSFISKAAIWDKDQAVCREASTMLEHLSSNLSTDEKQRIANELFDGIFYDDQEISLNATEALGQLPSFFIQLSAERITDVIQRFLDVINNIADDELAYATARSLQNLAKYISAETFNYFKEIWLDTLLTAYNRNALRHIAPCSLFTHQDLLTALPPESQKKISSLMLKIIKKGDHNNSIAAANVLGVTFSIKAKTKLVDKLFKLHNDERQSPETKIAAMVALIKMFAATDYSNQERILAGLSNAVEDDLITLQEGIAENISPDDLAIIAEDHKDKLATELCAILVNRDVSPRAKCMLSGCMLTPNAEKLHTHAAQAEEVLKTNLESKSEENKLAAIEAISRVDEPSKDLLRTLIEQLDDDSIKVKELTSKVIRQYICSGNQAIHGIVFNFFQQRLAYESSASDIQLFADILLDALSPNPDIPYYYELLEAVAIDEKNFHPTGFAVVALISARIAVLNPLVEPPVPAKDREYQLVQ